MLGDVKVTNLFNPYWFNISFRKIIIKYLIIEINFSCFSNEMTMIVKGLFLKLRNIFSL